MKLIDKLSKARNHFKQQIVSSNGMEILTRYATKELGFNTEASIAFAIKVLEKKGELHQNYKVQFFAWYYIEYMKTEVNTRELLFFPEHIKSFDCVKIAPAKIVKFKGEFKSIKCDPDEADFWEVNLVNEGWETTVAQCPDQKTAQMIELFVVQIARSSKLTDTKL